MESFLSIRKQQSQVSKGVKMLKYAKLPETLRQIMRLAGARLSLLTEDGRSKSLSVNSLAQRLGRNRSTLTNWVRGERNPGDNDIDVMCYVCDVPRRVLLFGDVTALGPLTFRRTWPPQAPTISAEASLEMLANIRNARLNLERWLYLMGTAEKHLEAMIFQLGLDPQSVDSNE